MTTIEHSTVGPRERHANGKALWSLLLGGFAMLNVVAFALFMAFSVEILEDSGAWWMLLPFFGLIAGLLAAFLGAVGWIDVRRGVTDRRLFQAQFGAVLGGIAAGLVLLAIAAVFVVVIILAFSVAGEGGVMMD